MMLTLMLIFVIYFCSGEEDSKTSAKEDLKSYEEAASTTPDTQPFPQSLESLKSSGMRKTGQIQLVCNSTEYAPQVFVSQFIAIELVCSAWIFYHNFVLYYRMTKKLF
jgi:hypothetical protein